VPWPPYSRGFLWFLDHTQPTHHSRYDSSGRVISSWQRPLPDNTQHSQQTDIHVHGEIRNHDLSRRAALDLRLRPRGHWDQHLSALLFVISKSIMWKSLILPVALRFWFRLSL